MLKAIFLDFGNTIAIERVFVPGALTGIIQFVQKHSPRTLNDEQSLIEQLKATPSGLAGNHPLIQDVRGQSFDDRFYKFQNFAKDCGVTMTADLCAEMMHTYDQAAAHCDCIFEGAEGALKQLAQHHKLVIVSNGYSPWVAATLKHHALEQYFTAVLVSQDYNREKPDRFFYQIAADAAQVTFDQALMVGDSWRWDVAGAKQWGMKTCWINPDHLAMPDRAACDYDIETLAQLPAVLSVDQDGTACDAK